MVRLDVPTPSPLPSGFEGSPAPAASPTSADLGGALVPHLNNEQVTGLIGILAILLFVALATPIFLNALNRDFFKTAYITWYLLHWGVAICSLIILAILALASLLSSPLIALFASVFGYVLGSNASRGTSPPSGPKPLTVDKIQPAKAAAQSTIAITGQGFVEGTTVRIGGQPMTDLLVSADGTLMSGKLPAGAAGKVEVVVKNPDGSAKIVSEGFEFS